MAADSITISRTPSASAFAGVEHLRRAVGPHLVPGVRLATICVEPLYSGCVMLAVAGSVIDPSRRRIP